MSMEKVETPELGKTYNLRHRRFGRANVKVIQLDETWLEVLIEAGTLRGAADEWGPGEKKMLRREHCYLTETGKQAHAE